MRRIISWLSATVLAVALLTGYQVGFASGGDREGGDTSVHQDKPGESK